MEKSRYPFLSMLASHKGSPLSPILFILYIASLYEALEEVAKISVIGFADDTNIIAFGQTAQENCRTLERAWAVCEKWSESRGMEFEPGQSELIHFSRTRNPLAGWVQLGNTTKELYSVPGSMVGQETHMESTPKRSPTETGNATARADQAGGCVLGFLPSQSPRSVHTRK